MRIVFNHIIYFLSFSVFQKYLGHPPPPENGKNNFEFQRIAFDRSKMSEEEAFEHAIEMIQTRQMGFRKAADFFSVSKWKLYKTARKRGIYAEIKKQNAAQVIFDTFHELMIFLECVKSILYKCTHSRH